MALNCKIVVTGSEKVGKTSCIRRFIQDTFPGNYLPTLGFEISVKTLQVSGETIILSIWDVGAQNPDDTRKKFYQGAVGYFVVFDVTNRSTFDSIDNFCFDIRRISPFAPIVLIGNKVDLPDHMVAIEELRQKAKKYNAIGCILTSAKSGEGVQSAFVMLGKTIVATNRREKS